MCGPSFAATPRVFSNSRAMLAASWRLMCAGILTSRTIAGHRIFHTPLARAHIAAVGQDKNARDEAIRDQPAQGRRELGSRTPGVQRVERHSVEARLSIDLRVDAGIKLKHGFRQNGAHASGGEKKYAGRIAMSERDHEQLARMNELHKRQSCDRVAAGTVGD